MKKMFKETHPIKLIALAVMLVFLAIAPGVIYADETLVTPNKLVVFKIGDYNYYTQDIGNSQVSKIKMNVAPLIKENRTFVPVRYLANALGVNDSNIKWDNTTHTATLNGKAELELTIGEKAVTTNGRKEAIDVAPYIIPPGRTMLPARYVAEGLGFKVEWDSVNSLAICYPLGTQKPDMAAILKEVNAKPIVVDKKPDGVKQAVIDTRKYKRMETADLKASFPEFYSVKVGYGGVLFRSKGQHRFVCTNYPELNRRSARSLEGVDYIEKNDILHDWFGATYGMFDGKLKDGMTLKYDVFNEAGVKIYDLTVIF